MMFADHSLMAGHVEHRRLNPIGHQLKYRVFSLLVDLDQVEELDRRCRLFSVNRWNFLSLYTSDLADGRCEDLAEFARDLLRQRLPGITASRIWLLTYPRIFGYVFNPLSVYFCLDDNGKMLAAIYEVSNTFGGRTHYVQPMGNNGAGNASKDMVVSPFNGSKGRYGFAVSIGQDQLTLGVSLRENRKPVLKTWLKADRLEFTDRQVAGVLLKFPLMTLKVITAIHFEALKLWIKGLRPPSKGLAKKGPSPDPAPWMVKKANQTVRNV